MGRLRLQSRWAPWWFALMTGAIYAPLLYAVVIGLLHPDTDGRMIRIFIPIFGVITYLVVAVLVNRQVSVTDPSGVQTTLRPFPIGSGHKVARQQIESLYVGRIRIKKRGAVIEEFFVLGVRTRDGVNIDLLASLEGMEQATTLGRQVQQILNVELFRDDTPSPNPAFKRTALVWVGLFLLATFLGAYWEIRSGG